jgi:ribosomal protein L13
MCCGKQVVVNQLAKTAEAAAKTWTVVDASGNVVSTKTSEIAAKLAAARVGGRVVQR